MCAEILWTSAWSQIDCRDLTGEVKERVGTTIRTSIVSASYEWGRLVFCVLGGGGLVKILAFVYNKVTSLFCSVIQTVSPSASVWETGTSLTQGR